MNVELALRVLYMLGEVITDKVSRFGKLELIVMCFPSLLTCIHHDNCTLYAHDVHKYHSLTPLSKEHLLLRMCFYLIGVEIWSS